MCGSALGLSRIPRVGLARRGRSRPSPSPAPRSPREDRARERASRSRARRAALGLAGYAVNTGGYNIGLFYAPPAEVALLLGVNNTLQVILWSRLLLREVPTRMQATGIGVGVVGTLLFYGLDGAGLAHPAVIGAVGLAGVGYGLWIVGDCCHCDSPPCRAERQRVAGRRTGPVPLLLT
jgi:drug/metabolite transporter (DMT)-like permease